MRVCLCQNVCVCVRVCVEYFYLWPIIIFFVLKIYYQKCVKHCGEYVLHHHTCLSIRLYVCVFQRMSISLFLYIPCGCNSRRRISLQGHFRHTLLAIELLWCRKTFCKTLLVHACVWLYIFSAIKCTIYISKDSRHVKSSLFLF